jgi:hypothetical protein
MTCIFVFPPQSKPMTQATMAGLGLLTFYQYLIHVVVHEGAILNMLGMFMFVVATVTWATPALEIVSNKKNGHMTFCCSILPFNVLKDYGLCTYFYLT